MRCKPRRGVAIFIGVADKDIRHFRNLAVKEVFYRTSRPCLDCRCLTLSNMWEFVIEFIGMAKSTANRLMRQN
jgi:hypothetical protein